VERLKGAKLDRYLDLHTWTGVIAGMALFIAFYAGSITVFHDELHSWQAPADAGEYTADDAPAFMDKLLREFPNAGENLFMMLPGAGHGLTAFWYDKDHNGGEWRHATADDFRGGSFEESRHSELADLVNSAHYSLTIPEIGINIMGFIALLFAVAMLSGLVIHWRKLVREVFTIRHQGNRKRYWKNLHNVVGVLSFPFHMIFAITGAAMGLFTVIGLLMGTLAFDPQEFEQAVHDAREFGPTVTASGEPGPILPMNALMDRAREVTPEGFTPTYLRYHHMGDANGQAIVYGNGEKSVAPWGGVAMKLTNGEVQSIQVPGARDANHAALSGMYSLHFGNFDGLVVKGLWFLLGITGAFLFYSGNILWVTSREKQTGRAPVTLLRLTIGICLGVCLAISATFVATPILINGSWPADVGLAEKIVFYIVWAASLAAAFLVNPARVSVGLLRATAIITALIPVSHGLAGGDFIWDKLAQGHWDAAVIDLGALGVAIGFALLACMTRRRFEGKSVNSVWEIQDSQNGSTQVA
jgi:uncharacterized iron-regulated membrane protein